MSNKQTLKQKIEELEKKYFDLTFAIDRGFVSDTTDMCNIKIELDKVKKEYEKLLEPREWIEFKLEGQTVNEKKISIARYVEACIYKISVINEYGNPAELSDELLKEREKLKLLEVELERLS
ncbi:MAG: hypothetical protein R2883_08405 [Caldisericia bacterium]